MPAPTALQRAPTQPARADTTPTLSPAHDDHTSQLPTITSVLDLAATNKAQPTPQSDAMLVDTEDRPIFAPENTTAQVHRAETRKVLVPPHRFSPLKAAWPKIYPPLVEHLQLQVRMNVKAKAVELRTSKFTTDTGALQKGEDFVKAFTLGFDVYVVLSVASFILTNTHAATMRLRCFD